jgi:hypothetical protein
MSMEKYGLERENRMTKKDFELIAEVLATAKESISGLRDPDGIALYLAWEFADRLCDENPGFSHDRFLAAAAL